MQAVSSRAKLPLTPKPVPILRAAGESPSRPPPPPIPAFVLQRAQSSVPRASVGATPAQGGDSPSSRNVEHALNSGTIQTPRSRPKVNRQTDDRSEAVAHAPLEERRKSMAVPPSTAPVVSSAPEDEAPVDPAKQTRRTPPRIPPRSNSPIVVPSSRSTRPTTPTSSAGGPAQPATPQIDSIPRSVTSTPVHLPSSRAAPHDDRVSSHHAELPPPIAPALAPMAPKVEAAPVPPPVTALPIPPPPAAAPQADATAVPAVVAAGPLKASHEDPQSASLTVILSGGAAASTGSRIFQLSLDAHDFSETLVADVKAALDDYCGVPAAQQLLMHRTTVLTDDRTLGDEGIVTGAIISLDIASPFADAQPHGRSQQREDAAPVAPIRSSQATSAYPDRTKSRQADDFSVAPPRTAETIQLEERVAALEDALLSLGPERGKRQSRGRSASDSSDIPDLHFRVRHASSERAARRSATPPIGPPATYYGPPARQAGPATSGFSVEEYEFDLLSYEEQTDRIEELQRTITQQQELLRWMLERAKGPNRSAPRQLHLDSGLVLPSAGGSAARDGLHEEDYNPPATEAWRTRMRRARNL